MSSNMERRKVSSHLRSILRALPAGTAAAVAVLASGGFGQAPAEPVLSVFRKDVGVISSNRDEITAQRSDVSRMDAVAGDFDGDGELDLGTFDGGSGLFTIRASGDGSTLVVSVPRAKGKAVVASADYDGDKRVDPAVWSNGVWRVLLSSRQHASDLTIFGIPGDVPVPADYDGDGRADFALFRPSENRWYVRSSETGQVRTADFGSAGTDLLLPADYTGDGKADLAVYRKGVWHVIDSETSVEDTFHFGFDDARPVPGDFDRDGQTDYAVYRKGTWYVYDGSRIVSYKFGNEDDIPLGSVAVRHSSAVQ